jgi:hypothetical protein
VHRRKLLADWCSEGHCFPVLFGMLQRCSPRMFRRLGDRRFERSDCFRLIEAGFVHFGRDGIGDEMVCSGVVEKRHAAMRQPNFLVAEREEHRHAVVDRLRHFVGSARIVAPTRTARKIKR